MAGWCNYEGGLLSSFGDDLEQELGADFRQWRVAQFIEAIRSYRTQRDSEWPIEHQLKVTFALI